MKLGDIVAIRGDKRLQRDGSCMYTPNQLIQGKYVRHTGHDGIWTGPVEKLSSDRVKVGGGWWSTELIEIITPKQELNQ